MSLLPQRIQQGQDPARSMGSQTLFQNSSLNSKQPTPRSTVSSDHRVSMYFTGHKNYSSLWSSGIKKVPQPIHSMTKKKKN